MTPQERQDRARKAKNLLEDKLMQEVFREVRDALIVRLESSAIGDRDTQHEIALTLQLLKQLRAHLDSWVNDGTLAEAEIKHESWLSSFARARARRQSA